MSNLHNDSHFDDVETTEPTKRLTESQEVAADLRRDFEAEPPVRETPARAIEAALRKRPDVDGRIRPHGKTWKKGQSGNPGGKRKAFTEMVARATGDGRKLVRALCDIAYDSEAKHADLSIVRDFLGHDNVQQTNTYLSTNLAKRRDALVKRDGARTNLAQPPAEADEPAVKTVTTH